MKKILVCCVLICAGCTGRNSWESGLSTKYSPDVSKIHDIALEFKYKREF